MPSWSSNLDISCNGYSYRSNDKYIKSIHFQKGNDTRNPTHNRFLQIRTYWAVFYTSAKFDFTLLPRWRHMEQDYSKVLRVWWPQGFLNVQSAKQKKKHSQNLSSKAVWNHFSSIILCNQPILKYFLVEALCSTY